MANTRISYDIEAVRKQWIGQRGEIVRGRYPVEYETIRRHCYMTEDTNPLFLDPEFAATTKYGSVIAPAVQTDFFSWPGLWPPVEKGGGNTLLSKVPTIGDRKINLNTTWEFHLPVKIGDRLYSYPQIVDVYMKPIRLDPKSVWILYENRIFNQNDELVAVGRNTLLSHRPPEEVAADPDAEKN